MHIEFIEDTEENERLGGGDAYIAVADGVAVGKARVRHCYEAVWEIRWLYQTDEGKAKMDFAEYADAFFAFMKSKGCTEVIIENDEDELKFLPGFELYDRDNSGWYPRYYFRREL